MAHPALPRDKHSRPIQVLTPDDESVVEVAIAPGNQRVALPTQALVVEVASNADCRIAFGDSAVDVTVGTRRVFPSGTAVYSLTRDMTHVAVTSIGGSSGIVTVTRLM